MSEIKINFDLIHVIKEAEGIKKCPKEFSIVTKPFVFLYPTDVFLSSINDSLPVNSIITATTIATILSIGVEQLLLFLTLRKTTMELANSKLNYLVLLLKDINIVTDTDILLNSKVYYSEYNLKKDSPKGIIRNRYINLPSYNYKGEEVMTSIKEEHILATREYLLSIGEPQKMEEKVYTKEYGMA